jgi:excisionase family DNA binding protein
MNVDRLLTTAQVAERVRVDVRTVTRWLRAGRLRGHKSGQSWRIAPADLEAFLDSCANRPHGGAAAPSAHEGRAREAYTCDIMAGAKPPEIEIRPFEFQPIEEPSYLKVRTYPRPTDRSIRLGVIEWIGSGPRAGKVLVNRKPMSHSDAMAYAKRFAEKFRVPLIYQREDDPASAASDRSGAE